jgi:hypothetical protein
MTIVTIKEDVKLLPCPFCGGRADFVTQNTVECTKCPACMYFDLINPDYKHMGSMWNKRKPT